MEYVTAEQARASIRAKEFTGPTAGVAKGYTQANLAILKKEHAFDFLLFCQRNEKQCPLIDVLDAGSFTPSVAPTADIRTDIPKYRIYKDGILTDEVTDIMAYWEDDFVAFLIGCSFTFEAPLLEANIPIRHIEERCNVPMYKTNIACQKAGIFEGPTVVSMRPMKATDAIRAVQITSRFPAVHGAPIHIGDAAQIGITNIQQPDFGDAVTIHADEVPVFWACGATPQAVAIESKPSIMITHAPGHMFITDVRDETFSVL